MAPEVWWIAGGLAAAALVGMGHCLAAEVAAAKRAIALKVRVELLKKQYHEAAKKLGMVSEDVEILEDPAPPPPPEPVAAGEAA